MPPDTFDKSVSIPVDIADHERLDWSNLGGQNKMGDHDGRAPKAISGKDPSDRVAVVLGYYNGNRFIKEQLRSILDQSHEAIDIFISDDCSSEALDVDRLNLTTSDAARVNLGIQSKNLGFAKNFLSALNSIDDKYEYFAFSDQDDIWFRDKVAKAISIIKQLPEDQPILYCGRTVVTDENGEGSLSTSPLFVKPPAFANALVQSIGNGCTMVLNQAAKQLVVEASIGIKPVSHDWWCYQIVSGAGGIVYFDDEPCMKYRQHSTNIVGLDNGWGARLTRLRGMFAGKTRGQNDINLEALAKRRYLLTQENQNHLDDFIRARNSSLLTRLFLFKRSGIYQQTLFGKLGLHLGVLLNRI